MISSDRYDLDATGRAAVPPSGKTILLADSDLASARRLAMALRRRGHRVLSVRDGSKALEVAVLRAPDLVLYDMECPLLDAGVFAEILRANPRTSNVPVVLMGMEDAAERVRESIQTGYLQKPFNIDEVLSRISLLLRRVEAAEKVRKAGAIEGSLEQITLPDILQMLSMNRRSGVLRISPPSTELGETLEAELLLSDGRVSDARIGDISGEKALFRIVSWEAGSFTFSPEAPSGSGRISLGVDEALMEGLRQKDELVAMEEKTPARDDVLAVAVDKEHLPGGLHPVTQEVIGLLEHYRTCGEIIDHARATDLDAMRAISTLMDRGLVRVLGRAIAEDGGKALVPSDTAFALHGQIVATTGGGRTLSTVVVGAPDPSQLGRMVASMSGVAGWKPDTGPRLLDLGFGGLGEVRLSDSVRIALTALPTDDALLPLWRPFGSGALGAVVVAGQQVRGLVDYLLEEGIPLVLAGPDADEYAAGFQGKVACAPDFLEGLSRLLEIVARGRGARGG